MAKSFTPIFHYPTEKTGFFTGEEEGIKLVKNILDSDHSAYGGWWPTFFPTAISFLVTGDRDKYNVMTVSSVVVVNAFPFMLGMPIFAGSKSPRGDGPRYSLELLQANPEFTINLPYIDKVMTKKVIICGSLSGRTGDDKFEKANFTAAASSNVGPPIIAECPLNIECRIHSMELLGTHYWVIGKALTIHLDKEIAAGRYQFVWRSLPELKKRK